MRNTLRIVRVTQPSWPAVLLACYVSLATGAGIAPVDRQAWLLTSVLPTAFVVLLATTYRRLPLSNGSYALIGVFLALHTIGAHYT
jgi:putative membrane protein